MLTDRVLIACLWTMPLYLLLLGLGLSPLGMQFMPPPSPTATAPEMAEFYAAHSRSILTGGVLMIAACALMAPMLGAMTSILQRIEGAFTPLSYTQFAFGVCAIMMTTVSVICFVTAAYRIGRSPDEIRLLNDIGWFGLVITAPFGFVRSAAIGLIFVLDPRTVPIVPRWVGWLLIASGVATLPGMFAPLFKEGPLAWNGWLAWDLGANAYFIAWIVLFIYLLRAVRRPIEPVPAAATNGGCA